jgi:hypothetical protein
MNDAERTIGQNFQFGRATYSTEKNTERQSGRENDDSYDQADDGVEIIFKTPRREPYDQTSCNDAHIP